MRIPKYYTPDISVQLENGYLTLKKDFVCIHNNNITITNEVIINEFKQLLISKNLKSFSNKLKPGFIFELTENKISINRAIYLEFSNLSSETDIIEFINKYGFIGINIKEHKKIIDIFKNKTHLFFIKLLFEYSITGYKEKIVEIQSEINKIHFILNTIDQYNNFIKKPDENVTLTHLTSLEENMDIALEYLNRNISQMQQYLHWEKEDLDDKIHLCSHWNIETLLQFMYVCLFEDLSGHILPRNCKRCGCSFLPNRQDQIYCQNTEIGAKTCKEKAKQTRYVQKRKEINLKMNPKEI